MQSHRRGATRNPFYSWVRRFAVRSQASRPGMFDSFSETMYGAPSSGFPKGVQPDITNVNMMGSSEAYGLPAVFSIPPWYRMEFFDLYADGVFSTPFKNTYGLNEVINESYDKGRFRCVFDFDIIKNNISKLSPEFVQASTMPKSPRLLKDLVGELVFCKKTGYPARVVSVHVPPGSVSTDECIIHAFEFPMHGGIESQVVQYKPGDVHRQYFPNQYILALYSVVVHSIAHFFEPALVKGKEPGPSRSDVKESSTIGPIIDPKYRSVLTGIVCARVCTSGDSRFNLHMRFPNLIVDVHRAKALASMINETLDSIFSGKPALDTSESKMYLPASVVSVLRKMVGYPSDGAGVLSSRKRFRDGSLSGRLKHAVEGIIRADLAIYEMKKGLRLPGAPKGEACPYIATSPEGCYNGTCSEKCYRGKRIHPGFYVPVEYFGVHSWNSIGMPHATDVHSALDELQGFIQNKHDNTSRVSIKKLPGNIGVYNDFRQVRESSRVIDAGSVVSILPDIGALTLSLPHVTNAMLSRGGFVLMERISIFASKYQREGYVHGINPGRPRLLFSDADISSDGKERIARVRSSEYVRNPWPRGKTSTYSFEDQSFRPVQNIKIRQELTRVIQNFKGWPRGLTPNHSFYPYRNPKIRRMYQTGKKLQPNRRYIVGLDDKMCCSKLCSSMPSYISKQGCHHKNTVFFVIYPDRMVQRCYSNKDTCTTSEQKTNPHPGCVMKLSGRSRSILFGHK